MGHPEVSTADTAWRLSRPEGPTSHQFISLLGFTQRADEQKRTSNPDDPVFPAQDVSLESRLPASALDSIRKEARRCFQSTPRDFRVLASSP